uniref:Uncharacterized protein n=1 Tax=Setaria italica TaxID=4555 RepID=K4A3X0_SETIT
MIWRYMWIRPSSEIFLCRGDLRLFTMPCTPGFGLAPTAVGASSAP